MIPAWTETLKSGEIPMRSRIAMSSRLSTRVDSRKEGEDPGMTSEHRDNVVQEAGHLERHARKRAIVNGVHSV